MDDPAPGPDTRGGCCVLRVLKTHPAMKEDKILLHSCVCAKAVFLGVRRRRPRPPSLVFQRAAASASS
jgi:hypothetical protein